MISWFTEHFRWEPDNWWWEKVRLDEMGMPASWNFVMPDKLMHFLACFALTWLGYAIGLNKYLAASLAWFLMMGPWEIMWDGCFRYGASWRDMAADTLGVLVCLWWLHSYDTVGQVAEIPTR